MGKEEVSMNKIKWLFVLSLIVTSLLGACSQENSTLKSDDGKEVPKEVNIYLVRHGKTMFNTTDQVQGWSDTPLTDIGIEQANKGGKGLSDITFTTAYSSDLGRARSTAKLILENNSNDKPDLVELVGLREWGYGGYEGRNNADMWTPLFQQVGLTFDAEWSQAGEFIKKMSDEDIANAIAKNDPTKTAENYDAIVERSKEAIEQIVNETLEKGGGNALAVSHGSEIPTILSIFVPESYHGEGMDNLSLTILNYKDGKYTLKTVGDTTYMKE
jgi:broad specificity phosphatase PhoE